MRRRLAVALPILAACASTSIPRGVSEGVTPNGIAYDVRGAGPTVVLLHGGILDRRMWDYEAGAWSSRFRVVRYDLRGHGRSADIGAPYSASDDLAAVLDAVGAPRAHLVGLSKGGSVALDFALTHPNRVDRLVLAGAFPSGAQITERLPGIDSLIMATRRGEFDRAASWRTCRRSSRRRSARNGCAASYWRTRGCFASRRRRSGSCLRRRWRGLATFALRRW